jgi:hypothetical protein
MGWIIAGSVLGSGLLGVVLSSPEVLVKRNGQMVRHHVSVLQRFAAGVVWLGMIVCGLFVGALMWDFVTGV